MMRELRLRRRRSRVPWVYLVYQQQETVRGAEGAGVRKVRCAKTQNLAPPHFRTAAPDLALPAKKRRYVERRVDIEAVLLW